MSQESSSAYLCAVTLDDGVIGVHTPEEVETFNFSVYTPDSDTVTEQLGHNEFKKTHVKVLGGTSSIPIEEFRKTVEQIAKEAVDAAGDAAHLQYVADVLYDAGYEVSAINQKHPDQPSENMYKENMYNIPNQKFTPEQIMDILGDSS
jgi:hypothetical protein